MKAKDNSWDWYYSCPSLANSFSKWLPMKLEEINLSNLLENGNFTDFGCGYGDVLSSLQKKYPNLPMIGIDFNPNCLKKAKRKLSDNVSLIESNLENIPLKDNSVSIGFSSGIYQLCNENNYSKIASEITRVIEKGGLYFAVENMKKYKKPFLHEGLQILEDDSLRGIIFKK